MSYRGPSVSAGVQLEDTLGLWGSVYMLQASGLPLPLCSVLNSAGLSEPGP